jgi:hypothetical protein
MPQVAGMAFSPVRLPALKLAMALAATTPALAAEVWEKLPPIPGATGGAACAEIDGRIYVVGGTNWQGDTKLWLNSVYRFDPQTRRWSTLPPLAQAIAYPVSAVVDGTLIVLGGTDGVVPFAGVIRVDGARAVVAPSGGIAAPSVLASGGAIGGEIIVAGGGNMPIDVRSFGSAAAAWNLRTGAVRPLPPAPGVLGVAAGVVIRDELLVFGGGHQPADASATRNRVEAYAFSPGRNAWRALKPLPRPARGLAALALDDRHVYLGGGCDDHGFTTTAYLYDVVTDTYAPAPAFPVAAMMSLARGGDYAYCLGGEDRGKHRTDAAFRARISDLLP